MGGDVAVAIDTLDSQAIVAVLDAHEHEVVAQEPLQELRGLSPHGGLIGLAVGEDFEALGGPFNRSGHGPEVGDHSASELDGAGRR